MLYVAFATLGAMRLPHPYPFGGPISSYWYSHWLWHIQAMRGPMFPQAWVTPWLYRLDFTYLAAMAATLLARWYRPKLGRLLTLFLNCALLAAFPLGQLVGLYGLWRGEVEKADGAPKSWLGKCFAFALTPITDQSTNMVTRLLAAALQIILGRAFVRFVSSHMLLMAHLILNQFIHDGHSIQTLADLILDIGMLVCAWQIICGMRCGILIGVCGYLTLLNERTALLGDMNFSLAGANGVFIFASLVLCPWLFWYVWGILRSQRTHPNTTPAHV
jgi:hypothetical protein